MAMLALGLGLSPATETVDAAPRVPLYDTAWDMPFWASLDQVDQYFDHLQNSGYTGVWLSVMNHTGGGLTGVSPTLGTTQATLDNGQFNLRSNYRDQFRQILDRAQARNLRVGVVPVWGHGYLHTNRNGACDGTNAGPLKANNSWEIGREIAQAFANHQAVEYWILGGDNFCSPVEDGSIWANMAAGLENGGARQPMTYHTAGWPGRHLLFADQPWVDFLSPQTAHCIPADEARRDLARVVNSTSKPVFAAEMRYEAIQPTWGGCQSHGPGNPVRPADVRADTQAALDAGVNAIVYGHNERWQWGNGANGSRGGGWNSVRASFGAGGETSMLQLLGATGPPVTVPPTQPPGNNTRIDVIARGTTGSERVELRINESTVAGYNLSTGFRTYTFNASGQVNASQIKVAFTNDNGPRDVVVDAIVVRGQRYESEAASTRSLGSWNGSCGVGFKQTDVLHCNGYFQYDQSGSNNGTQVDVIARGATGSERLELRINDAVVRTFTVGTGFQSYSYTVPGAVSASQVKVAFTNDNGTNRDAIVDKVIIGGQTFETEAGSVRSTGTWSGSCAPGNKRSQVLHCNGYFHYGQ